MLDILISSVDDVSHVLRSGNAEGILLAINLLFFPVPAIPSMEVNHAGISKHWRLETVEDGTDYG